MDLGENSIFSYCICRGNENNISNGHTLDFKAYTVLMSAKTVYEFRENEDFACLIIGISACLCDDMSAMDWIWKNCQSIESVISAEKYLGGKYVLFIRLKERYYVLGDATCSVPIFYSTDVDGFLCSAWAFQIAKEFQMNPDERLMKIRRSGDSSETMPFDYTVWKNIKRLLPNHYLDCGSRKSVRYVNHSFSHISASVEDVIKITLPYICRLIAYYQSISSVACALTAGRDSRAVLAVLGCEKDIPVYTIRHNDFTDKTSDITVPRLIAEKMNLEYTQFSDFNLTEKELSYADSFLGKGNYKKRTLMLAHTIKNSFGKYSVVNGDIIGQVGKCSLHRDIPARYAVPSYFLCKLHNYSKEAELALGEWLDEIKAAGEYVNTFDLFSIENRLGVWAANENEIYNMIGQYYLNIFNSRCIVYEWTCVSRKVRKDSAIHLAMIKALKPELLDFPFEPSGFLERFSKSNGYTYLVASYFKHYIEKYTNRK